MLNPQKGQQVSYKPDGFYGDWHPAIITNVGPDENGSMDTPSFHLVYFDAIGRTHRRLWARVEHGTTADEGYLTGGTDPDAK